VYSQNADPRVASVRAVVIRRFGGPDVLRIARLPSPQLPADGVRIRVAASGINFADVQMRVGLYPEAPKVPFVPGFEVAGIVTEVGSKVASVALGDRVLSLCRFGGYASEIVLPAAFVRSIPGHLSDAEAAAVPVAFVTAWISLVDMARVRSGDRVLVPGAAGGVGTAVIQLASRAGAHVVGLVGSPSKKDLALSLGAHEVFTYDEWKDRRRSERFDAVLEPRGGAEVRRSLALLAPGGRVVCYGVSSLVTGLRRSIPRAALGLLGTPLLNPISLAMSNHGIFGLNVLKYFDSEVGLESIANALEKTLEGFEKRHYRAVIGRTWPLEEAGKAHTFLQSRQGAGKLILVQNN
jgi:NADPH:quinone reductase-like Zn-dependent oxidoreductase